MFKSKRKKRVQKAGMERRESELPDIPKVENGKGFCEGRNVVGCVSAAGVECSSRHYGENSCLANKVCTNGRRNSLISIFLEQTKLRLFE